MPHNPHQHVVARHVVQTQEAREMIMSNRSPSSLMDRARGWCHIGDLLPDQVDH